MKKIQGIRNLLKIFYTSDNELGKNDEIPNQENVGRFDENINVVRRDIISIASSSWNTTTDNEITVLNGLLRIGYINETVLPWNSGRPLLIRYIWGINTNNGNEIFAFEVL
ncbi:unnamed protein product [Brugia timori]|uniref:Uncharacterized protein n=1 Tax=Brugia timori TaxID=42155 RepID=A0A0R3R7A6_9BILA|nr:unnamed protein product [Brugia timori]